MSEKYIDLRQAIFSDLRDRGRPIAVSIGDVLNWLDAHRDQVPGRTITQSEYREILNGAVLVSGYGDDWERGFSTGIVVAGTKVVPDPEPTNLYRLKGLLDEVKKSGLSADSAAEYLDKAGVTAPGSDDDH